jgi:hypothetical protein
MTAGATACGWMSWAPQSLHTRLQQKALFFESAFAAAAVVVAVY